MRADRLVTALLLLQARGRMTAAELAAELEVSVPTARRDLEALSAAGIPVYPQSGRHGGWQLVGGARTDLSGLTSAETRALFLLVGPAATLGDDAKSALRKLVRALPSTFREQAEAASRAVIVDPSAWGDERRDPPAWVDALQHAVVERRVVELEYRAWEREPVVRRVHPWGLVEKNRTWYLVGGVDGAERTYRVDRVVDLCVTEEISMVPEGFDLVEAWGRVDEVVRQRSRARAVVVVDSAIVAFIARAFADDEIEAEPGEPSSVLTLHAPTEIMLARRLAGWAEYLTVREPQSLRDELRRLGGALLHVER